MNENQIEQLRQDVSRYISGKRYLHTLAVEKEANVLADLFRLSPEDSYRLRTAALLHDITKQKTTEEQIALCEAFGIPYTENEIAAPKVFHAMTGAALAKADFPALADETVCCCIRWHTVGRPGMTLLEKLLFLADYIEETRTFIDCVELRKLFYGLPEDRSAESMLRHLDRIMITAYDMTVRCLLEDGAVISADTVAARNDLILHGTAHTEKHDVFVPNGKQGN